MDYPTNNYLRYYLNQQSGGRLDPFKGARRGQFGNGLGQILGGIFRTILPIAAHGASTFLSRTLSEKDANPEQSWKDSAKNALRPTAQKIIGQTLSQIQQQPSTMVPRRRRRLPKVSPQTGQGRRRRVRKTIRGKKHLSTNRPKKRNLYKKPRKSLTKRIKFLNF